MKIEDRFCLALFALVSISGVHAGSLKFEASTPEMWIRTLGQDSQGATSPVPDPGEVKAKVQQLWSGDRLIFEAKTIEDRSVSRADPATAIWAVSAVTGDRPPMTSEGEGLGPGIVERDGESFVDASPREVWIVTPDGKSRRLSKPDMDATRPVISPDGQFVAFSGRPLDAHGIPGQQAAYLVSIASGEIVELVHMEERHGSYLVGPLRWNADSRSVIIDETWGELGTQGTLRTVTILPEH